MGTWRASTNNEMANSEANPRVRMRSMGVSLRELLPYLRSASIVILIVDAARLELLKVRRWFF
jgi:hypothetical protein